MQVVELIQKKRDGIELEKTEINYLIKNYVNESIPDYQIASFLMATYINGMTEKELAFLTDAMLYSGDVVTHKDASSLLLDKHSTGGVGDKISIPLAPAVAACGVRVPMIAGRGLGHTGGTLDKLEAIPGFNCYLTEQQFCKQVEEIGCAIIGQTNKIVPADKKLYALRDVTGTIESIPLISSSIMSKKLAEGIHGLVLDIKYGTGAFMKDLDKARLLAKTMVGIGKRMNKKVTALITDMNQPLGNMIGNSLEIAESIDILQGKGPKDSIDLTVELGAEMLLLANKARGIDDGRDQILRALNSGAAYEKFEQMVASQGGSIEAIRNNNYLLDAPNKISVLAKESGFIKELNCLGFGNASNLLGGGRNKITDQINHSVGIELHKKVGDKIEKGNAVCTIYACDKGIKEAEQRINASILITQQEVIAPKLCLDRISSN